MRKSISVLLLFWLIGLGVAHAQAPAPDWVKKLKLSGLSGPGEHRLASINNQTFSLGEENDLRIAGHTVRLKCLKIGQDSVVVQIEDIASPYELYISGQVISLAPPPATVPQQYVTPVQSPAPVAPPPLPVVFSPPVVPLQTALSASDLSPKTTFSTRVLFMGGFALALLVGIAIGTGASVKAVQLIHQNEGEALVAETIKQQFGHPHHLINNITLPTEGGTTQIDHVLIADTGIFVIETKHYSGWIFGQPQESQWTQQHFRSKIRFPNPLRQNYGHLKELQSLFDLPDEVFHSVIVFTGEAQFKTDLGPKVIHLSGLVPFLSAERQVVFDEGKMACVVGRIEMRRERRSIETDEYHINNVRRKMAAKIPKPKPIPPRLAVPQAVQTDATQHPHSRFMPKC